MKSLDELIPVEEISRMMKALPRKIAVVAVNFSKERFRQQAWLDNGLKKWQPRKSGGKNSSKRAILVKSGRLRRSIRATSVTDRKIVIGTDVPYAQVHNEGGTGEISQNVRGHIRKEHSRKAYTTRNGRNVPAGKVQQHNVRAFTRKIKLNIPQRQFMGMSEALSKRIERAIKKDFEELRG